MVRKKYKDWDELLKNFPCETLKEINQLWLKNSNHQFGISIQTKIYQSLGGTSEYDRNICKKFFERLGWNKSYNALIENAGNGTVPKALLPAYFNSRGMFAVAVGWFWVKGVVGDGRSSILFSRAETCKV